jgi:transketolase
MGSIAGEAAAAAEMLAAQGIACGLAVVASIAPPPIDDLRALVPTAPLVLTVEAHYTVGGVGSLVAEVVAGHRLPCRVVRCGVHSTPVGMAGSQEALHQHYGLSRAALVERVLCELRGQA